MMPGSCEYNDITNSPSLISNLTNYCFQRNAKPYVPPVPMQNYKNLGDPTLTPPLNNSGSEGDLVIPETPEYRKPSSCASSVAAQNGSAEKDLSGDESDGPCFRRKVLGFCPPASQGNSSQSQVIPFKPSFVQKRPIISNSSEEFQSETMDEYDTFCGKEQSLRELLKYFPQADIMEAQDILVKCNWDLPKAIDIVKAMPAQGLQTASASNVSACATSLSKGVTYTSLNKDLPEPNHSFRNNRLGIITEEIVIDSDDDISSGKYNAKSTKARMFNHSINKKISQLSSSSQKLPASSDMKSKKRKRIICRDDSGDDDDHGASAHMLHPEGTRSQISRSNSLVAATSIGQLDNKDSDFSVLDFKPSRSIELVTLPKISRINKLQPGQLSNTKKIRKTNPSPTKMTKPSSSNYRNRQYMHQNPNTLASPVKHKRKKKYDTDDDDLEEDYTANDVYDSEESDEEIGEHLTPARNAVLKFLKDSTVEELLTIPGCSKKKAEIIIKFRPFESWFDLVQKLNSTKSLSADLLNGAKKVLDSRTAVSKLMNKCQRIALEMGDLVEALKENKEDNKDYVSKQPTLLNTEMHLTPYQMLGLNWLLLMHNQEVNGILADEMGLGKTIQAIAFLAYMKEQCVQGPHLIVVPSSTLDNWQNELHLWWPTVSVLCYHGSQESRRELRMKIVNDEIEDFDVMVTTYNMVTSSAEDRGFFKKLQFNYVIYDEAHMLKNMASQRYQHLMKVRASRRVLLTGTPLQNNLVELMSLLIFAMPHIFSGKTDHIKQMFSAVCKTDDGRSKFEKERIEHAKHIMKPFVLRRLKNDVLKDLPKKHEEVKYCPMTETQAKQYADLVTNLSEQVKHNKEKEIPTSGAGMMMQLRKLANHPLLLRYHYTEDKLLDMAQILLKDPIHAEANPDYIFEDMIVMSDFELHRMCKSSELLKSFRLDDSDILNSGKFAIINDLLSEMIEEGHRILMFSQFTMVLDVMEEFMNIKKYKFLRLDGQIPVHERQHLIDEYNKNMDIPVFLLSTRAGGLGINLTSADVVLIHDIDFNPYNDKQAEDRCHRVGQTRDVIVIRFISENTIEEGMLQCAKEKLKLEQDVTSANDDTEKDNVNVAKLLRDALGLSTVKS